MVRAREGRGRRSRFSDHGTIGVRYEKKRGGKKGEKGGHARVKKEKATSKREDRLRKEKNFTC